MTETKTQTKTIVHNIVKKKYQQEHFAQKL